MQVPKTERSFIGNSKEHFSIMNWQFIYTNRISSRQYFSEDLIYTVYVKLVFILTFLPQMEFRMKLDVLEADRDGGAARGAGQDVLYALSTSGKELVKFTVREADTDTLQ